MTKRGRNSYRETASETAGIIILAEQEGEEWDSADSDTAMGAFWVN